MTLPRGSRLVGLRRNPLRLDRCRFGAQGLLHASLQPKLATSLHLLCQKFLAALEMYGLSDPSTSLPLLRYHAKRPLPDALKHPSADRCHRSGRVPPSGFHTPSAAFSAFALAGLLHPAPDLGFITFHAVRASTCVGRRTAAIPVMPHPSKNSPHDRPYPVTRADAPLPSGCSCAGLVKLRDVDVAVNAACAVDISTR